MKPLQEKEETIYVVPKSDAEDHVKKRFPHKKVKHVRGTRCHARLPGSSSGMPHTFQRGQSEGLNAVFHFTFTGKEPKRPRLSSETRHPGGGWSRGDADLRLDRRQRDVAWIPGKERSLLWALLRGKFGSRDRRGY